MFFRIMGILGLLVLSTPAFSAEEVEAMCNGDSTPLYTDDDVTLTICHGPYTKINLSALDQWHDCHDAMIRIKRKDNAKTTVYVDCMVDVPKQFSIRGSSLLLRHFFTEYPGFDKKPILIETAELATNDRSYKFEGKLAISTRKDFEEAIKRIDSTLAKPFDNQAFFESIYGSFFKLRDYAAVDSKAVLLALQNYKDNDEFDGEVAETLGVVIEEVKLIHAANQDK